MLISRHCVCRMNSRWHMRLVSLLPSTFIFKISPLFLLSWRMLTSVSGKLKCTKIYLIFALLAVGGGGEHKELWCTAEVEDTTLGFKPDLRWDVYFALFLLYFGSSKSRLQPDKWPRTPTGSTFSGVGSENCNHLFWQKSNSSVATLLLNFPFLKGVLEKQ